MGKISGKSDFEDFCEMHHSIEEVLSKYKIFAYGNELVPLNMKSKKELVVYYPWLVGLMSSNKETGGVVHLSSENYLDIEEEQRIQNDYDEVLRYYKKCKRKKEKFDKNAALELIDYPWGNQEPYKIELINRISEMGAKASIDGLHTKSHDACRKEWYDLMVEEGWDENQAYCWVYGWKRWFENMNADRYGENSIQQKLDFTEEQR